MPKIPFSERLIRSTIAWLGFPLSLVQMLVSGCQQRRIKPTGWLADIGSRKLHVSETGQGFPTVILELGMGGCSLDWLVRAAGAETIDQSDNTDYSRRQLAFHTNT